MTHTKNEATQQKPNVSGDAVEWLCERCNCIHPSQTGGVLQPCPCCKLAMTPTSFNLREIKRLRAMLDAKSPVAQTEPVQQPVAWVDSVMTQAQVFASAWALVGSRFDSGNEMENAEQQKKELRAMLTTPPAN